MLDAGLVVDVLFPADDIEPIERGAGALAIEQGVHVRARERGAARVGERDEVAVTRLVRSDRFDCSPSTQRTASAIFDLPLPLGPMTALTPRSKTKRVGSAKVLKP